jgi:predicted Zn-dependent protease
VKRTVDACNSVSEYPATFRCSGHTAFAAIPVRHAFERAAWAEPAAALAVPKTPFAQAEAITWFGRPVGAARNGELAKAKDAVDRPARAQRQARQGKRSVLGGPGGHTGAGQRSWIALVEGRKAKAITGVRQAADLEGRSGKHVAIENRLSPMRELLGELLMDAQEPVQALKELETSLRNNPNRYCSFAGAARAADRAGDGYYEKLVTLAGNADTPRPDLIVAKQYLTSK